MKKKLKDVTIEELKFLYKECLNTCYNEDNADNGSGICFFTKKSNMCLIEYSIEELIGENGNIIVVVPDKYYEQERIKRTKKSKKKVSRFEIMDI